jgi:hypothetical protein
LRFSTVVLQQPPFDRLRARCFCAKMRNQLGGVYVAKREACAGHWQFAGNRQGIALKLAESGARVAVHYYQNEDAAKNTLTKIRECGSDGFVVQGNVCHAEEVSRIFRQVETEFGSLDIFVSNARTEAPTFYQPPIVSPRRCPTCPE